MNGLHLDHRPSPITEVRVVGRAPVRTARQRAALDALAVALTDRCRDHPAGTVADRLAAFARPVDVSVHAHGIIVAARCLAEDTDRLLAVLDDLLTPGGYDDRVVERAVASVRSRDRLVLPDDRTLRRRLLLDRWYDGAAWWARRPAPEDLAEVTAAELDALHWQVFLSQTTELVVVGDVDADRVDTGLPRWSLFHHHDRLPAPQPAPTRPTPDATTGERTEVVGGVVAGVTAIAPACTLDDPVHPALHLTSLVVAGGPESVLFRRLRDDGLVYQVRSDLVTVPGAGWLTLETAGRGPDQVRLVERIEQVLHELTRRGPDPADIGRARDRAVAMTSVGVCTDTDLASAVAGFRLAGLAPDWLDRQAALLAATPDDAVVRALREHAAPEHWLWAVTDPDEPTPHLQEALR